MPSAGAIIPPQVIPLRQLMPGVPSNRINTDTFIELETGWYLEQFDLSIFSFIRIHFNVLLNSCLVYHYIFF